jgi:hypothetical protein
VGKETLKFAVIERGIHRDHHTVKTGRLDFSLSLDLRAK